MDIIDIALSKKYTDESLKGIAGTLAGKNCTIKSTTKIDGVTTVVFAWTADDGTEVTFYVIEETRLGASNYLLVADSDDEDAECLILKDTSRDEDPEAVYELVEDETELDAVSKVFEELLSDEDITIE